MNVERWLKSAANRLQKAGIGTEQLDSLILLEDELGKDRAWLLAHTDYALQGSALQSLNKKVVRRAKHEPLAYIRGFTEFYGRKFIVDKAVLEPRPESETMIDILKDLIKHQAPVAEHRILDVGTGSEALAITAKLEMPEVEVVATDIDPRCLRIAESNARYHQAEIEFIQADLLLFSHRSVRKKQLLMGNLPYVPDGWTINKAAMKEPKQAIFGGPDGLDVYRWLFEQLIDSEMAIDVVLTESMPPQHKKLAQ
ncbi:peptide chain release factor N(5)-glutamine methyltransferase, partial [Candidatus Saccharibacteria bacterium]|nr:peptide chain release factor N(5)-glutamine methyltransferase [Candidatus Saccharibacteria bacterium]